MAGSALPDGRLVGSDFESLGDELSTHGTVPPWERSGRPTAYLETGRQALSLIGDALGRRGRDRLIVPGFLCESMVEPFLELGWEVTSFGLREDLGVPTSAHRMLASDPGRTAILLAAYFGRQPDAVHQAIAREAQRLGVAVIEDETHRVFRPGSETADFTFASLRKLLPVADGAYLQGSDDVLKAAQRLPVSDSRRWEAMDAKRGALYAETTRSYRTMFLEENNRLERTGRRFTASSRSVRTLGNLPYEMMADARVANANLLKDRVSAEGIAFLSISDVEVPSHFVVKVSDPVLLQERLAARGVYCAIHWPRVEGIAGIESWRSDLLSVPVDHRYDLRDMERVAEVLIEAIDR